MANEKKPNNFKISPWFIYIALIAVFIALNYYGGAGFQDTTKISYSKFSEYLNKGQIEKVIIYNKTEGEAYLTKEALKDKSNAKVAKDMLGNVNKGPHYSFDIGNDQSFQNNIEKAAQEGKIKDYDFKAKSNWGELLMTLLPFIKKFGSRFSNVEDLTTSTTSTTRHSSHNQYPKTNNYNKWEYLE